MWFVASNVALTGINCFLNFSLNSSHVPKEIRFACNAVVWRCHDPLRPPLYFSFFPLLYLLRLISNLVIVCYSFLSLLWLASSLVIVYYSFLFFLLFLSLSWSLSWSHDRAIQLPLLAGLMTVRLSYLSRLVLTYTPCFPLTHTEPLKTRSNLTNHAQSTVAQPYCGTVHSPVTYCSSSHFCSAARHITTAQLLTHYDYSTAHTKPQPYCCGAAHCSSI